MLRFRELISEAKLKPGDHAIINWQTGLSPKSPVKPTKVRVISIDKDEATIHHQGKRYNVNPRKLKKPGPEWEGTPDVDTNRHI